MINDEKLNLTSNRKKILIVDDEPSVRLVLKTILKQEYTIVATAGNGQEAFEAYRDFEPDLVTMDVVMPNFDGLYGVRTILDYDPMAKIVMITTIDNVEAARKLIDVGARDYIIKPFRRDRVLEGVAKLLKSKH